MLHWLAGQRPTDLDHTDQVEPPETPAPLFAVRAFKHAIFGTPSTATATRQRRNSNHEQAITRTTTRPIRPVLTRPKSANDAAGRLEDLPPSPTKGILLTPGTVGGRGKTVTFGDHVKSNIDTSEQPNSGDKRKRTSLVVGNKTQQDGISLDDLLQRKVGNTNTDTRDTCSSECIAMIGNVSEEVPPCSTGKYWKREYDIYRENTSKEVRKLITKQRAAKSYAREKDEQCAALRDELADEQKKVDALSAEVKSLQSKMHELENELRQARLSTSKAVPDACSNLHKHGIERIADVGELLDMPAPTGGVLSPFQSSVCFSPEDARSDQRSIQRRPSPQPRHDSLDPDESRDVYKSAVQRTEDPSPSLKANKNKEDTSTFEEAMSKVHGKTTTHASVAPEAIISKGGTVIPPDRVAAARARLAARRQQRQPM